MEDKHSWLKEPHEEISSSSNQAVVQYFLRNQLPEHCELLSCYQINYDNQTNTLKIICTTKWDNSAAENIKDLLINPAGLNIEVELQ